MDHTWPIWVGSIGRLTLDTHAPIRRMDGLGQVKEFRAKAKELSDETLVVLVGDMVTEEALPTYQTLLNTFEGAWLNCHALGPS